MSRTRSAAGDDRPDDRSARAWLRHEVDRNGEIVLIARALRAFAQGFLSILLALHLANRGFELQQIGLFLSAGVLGGGLYALALPSLAAWIGTRRLLIVVTPSPPGFPSGWKGPSVFRSCGVRPA